MVAKQLGDKCQKCNKRANPLEHGKLDPNRWHHCPRCGITFNKHTDWGYLSKPKKKGKK